MYVKNITLLGDAAHPMVPFLGQGGCMAIEDAYVFAALAKKMDCDFDKAQNLYQKIRMQRANKIQAASMFQAKLNHLENPIAIFFRNLIIRYTSVVSIRLKGIWDYDVDKEIKKIIN
jgi:2-polyprenyl-6-methoxyphenol hydroxylase-like FAD-dependent oxidoreductase